MPVFCAYVGRWRGAIQTSLIFILFPLLHSISSHILSLHHLLSRESTSPLPLRTLEVMGAAKLPMLSKKSTSVEDFD